MILSFIKHHDSFSFLKYVTKFFVGIKDFVQVVGVEKFQRNPVIGALHVPCLKIYFVHQIKPFFYVVN